MQVKSTRYYNICIRNCNISILLSNRKNKFYQRRIKNWQKEQKYLVKCQINAQRNRKNKEVNLKAENYHQSMINKMLSKLSRQEEEPYQNQNYILHQEFRTSILRMARMYLTLEIIETILFLNYHRSELSIHMHFFV